MYSHPLHSFPWQNGKTALKMATMNPNGTAREGQGYKACQALLQAAMNKVGRGRGCANATSHTNTAISFGTG